MGIQTELHEFIETNFWLGEGGVGDDDSLLESGILDSTGVVEVVTFLEATFGIAVADDEIVPEKSGDHHADDRLRLSPAQGG